mmetsp:Transcript_1483/g.4425  ORF Transcript_1483/g.4425 Transcript_1483/m.4425 type:complete len:401 (-) Transcript_1483:6-1208(-)
MSIEDGRFVSRSRGSYGERLSHCVAQRQGPLLDRGERMAVLPLEAEVRRDGLADAAHVPPLEGDADDRVVVAGHGAEVFLLVVGNLAAGFDGEMIPCVARGIPLDARGHLTAHVALRPLRAEAGVPRGVARGRGAAEEPRRPGARGGELLPLERGPDEGVGAARVEAPDDGVHGREQALVLEHLVQPRHRAQDLLHGLAPLGPVPQRGLRLPPQLLQPRLRQQARARQALAQRRQRAGEDLRGRERPARVRHHLLDFLRQVPQRQGGEGLGAGQLRQDCRGRLLHPLLQAQVLLHVAQAVEAHGREVAVLVRQKCSQREGVERGIELLLRDRGRIFFQVICDPVLLRVQPQAPLHQRGPVVQSGRQDGKAQEAHCVARHPAWSAAGKVVRRGGGSIAGGG